MSKLKITPFLFLLATLGSGCENSLSLTPAAVNIASTEARVDYISPELVRAGDSVTIQGALLTSNMELNINGVTVKPDSVSAQKLTFTVPDSLPAGELPVTLSKEGQTFETLKLWNKPKDAETFSDLPASAVCKGTKFTQTDGTTLEGEKICETPPANGKLPCTADSRIDCIASESFPSIDRAALLQSPAYAKNLSIAGVEGKIANCVAGEADCFVPAYSVMTQPIKAVNVNDFVPNLIKQGTTLANVTGTMVAQPALCSADAAIDCAANASFPAIDKTALDTQKALVRTDLTIGGVTGTLATCANNASNCYLPAYSSPSQPRKAVSFDSLNPALIKAGTTVAGVVGTLAVSQVDCNADNQTNCLATAFFPAVDKAYVNTNKAKIDSTLTIAGVAATLPACSSDGQIACTTVTAFPSVDKTNLNTNKSQVSSSLTLASISGTLANCVANASQCLLPAYAAGVQKLKAISFDSITANIIKSTSTIATVAGNVVEAPADCGADGQDACVTVTLFPATNKAAINTNKAKILDTLTLGGVAGTLPNCSIDGGTGCYTVTNFPAIDKSSVNTNKASIHSSISAGGINGTMNNCSADNQSSCFAVTNFPAVNQAQLDSNKAKMHTSLSFAGVTGTLASCAANGSNCYLPPYVTTTQPFKAIDYDALNASFIKTGSVIAGITGSADEAPADCASDGATSCVAVTNFPAMNKTTVDANKDKFLTTLTLGGITGTADDCGSDGATACLTKATYPALDKNNFDTNKAKVLPALSAAGVTGTLGTCAANGSDCYTPSYVITTQPLKAINFFTIAATNIKTSSSIAGVSGSMVPTPAVCAADGGTNCVTDASFPAMNYSNVNAAKSKILSNLTAGGVVGTLASCLATGSSSCFTTVTFPSYDKNATDTGKSKIRSSLTLDSITGTLADCGNNGSNCYLPAYALTTQPKKAISYDLLDPLIIKNGSVIGGVTGSVIEAPVDCSSNAQTGCVAVTNFPAVNQATATTNQAKIHTTLNVGGVVGTLASCNADAGTSCFTTATFPAVLQSNVNTNKAKVHSSLTIGGITGTMTSCAAQGSNCFIPSYALTTQPLKAISFDSLSAGVIKNGTSIAGITGNYPSASSPLSTGDALSDLDSTTFNTQMKSATSVGWFNRNGVRQNHAGDTDITATKIKTGVSIFGTAGSYTVPAAWDIRVGTSAGPLTGKLKTNCRNAANLSLQSVSGARMMAMSAATDTFTLASHGFTDGLQIRIGYAAAGNGGLSDVNTYYVRDATTNTFRIANTNGGAVIDLTGSDVAELPVARYGAALNSASDTVDIYNNGGASAPSQLPWGNNYLCDGIDTGSTSNVWLDVTTGGCASGKDCRFKDQITNLEWSKKRSDTYWSEAQRTCEQLTFDGETNWRLPTYNELIEATNHGIYSARGTNWLASGDIINNLWWSSSKKASPTQDAWSTDPVWGNHHGAHNMLELHAVVCVRKEGETP